MEKLGTGSRNHPKKIKEAALPADSAQNTGIDWVKFISTAFALICMFGTAFLSPPAGMTSAAFRILGITIGAMVLWLLVAVDWPNLLVILAMMLVPELGVKTVTAGALGNDTVFFLILCFMLSGCLTKTGVTHRLAIWFITCKFARKGPWQSVFMIFTAAFILGSGLSSTATVIVFLPILFEIFEALGYQKHGPDSLPSLMVFGLVLMAQIASASTPISHAMTLMGLATYSSYMSGTIDFMQYCAVCLPIALAIVVAWFVVCRFIIKPDLSRFSKIDFDRIKGKSTPMTREAKIASVVYLATIFLWVLPGAAKYVLPSLAPVLEKVSPCYPAIVGILVLHLTKTDNKRVFAYRDGLAAVPWNLVLFMGSIIMLGQAFSSPGIGISEWMASTLGPLTVNIPPIVFIIIMTCFTVILTTLISDAVTIAICHAIAMPLVITVFAGKVNPVMLSILITTSSNYGFLTPAATPPAAVAADSGWLSPKRMLSYGLLATLFCCIFINLIGIPLGTRLAG